MNEPTVWNDKSRNDLRESLGVHILGEIRLRSRDHDSILQGCQEIYIDDECPENERETFLQFAAEELERTVAALEVEQGTWPAETDCDRLDRVEAALRERGILLWQASPCCDTCTWGELGGRIDDINERFPGFSDKLRGCAFFIDQNLPQMLSESSELSVYLGYGWFSPDGKEVPPDEYERHALAVAREVSDSLRDEGFEVDWNGSFDRKLGLSLNWQRRTLLE